MSELFFADIPIAEGKLDDWIALIYDNPKGFALTITMPGFISAETAIMTDEKWADFVPALGKMGETGRFRPLQPATGPPRGQ
jgi:hypothetical protein